MALSGRRRLTATVDQDMQDIPASFDGREAFSECASVIGRVRDQSDCGSCWAFASTEVCVIDRVARVCFCRPR